MGGAYEWGVVVSKKVASIKKRLKRDIHIGKQKKQPQQVVRTWQSRVVLVMRGGTGL